MNINNRYCQFHPKRLQISTCFDTKCNERTKLCHRCIKERHSTCNKNLFVAKEELYEIVKIEKNSHSNGQLRELLDKNIKNAIAHFQKRLLKLKEDILYLFEKGNKIDLENDLHIRTLKKYCEVRLDEVQDRLLITPKANSIDSAEIGEKVKSLYSDIEILIDEGLDRIEKQNPFKIDTNKGIWLYNDWLDLKEEEKGTVMRVKQDVYFNSFSPVILTSPLTKESQFRFTIKSICKENRILPIGLINRQVYDTTKKQCILRGKGDVVLYFGCGIVGGLEGEIPTIDPSNSTGLEVGDKITMRYCPGDKIVFYNHKGTLNLEKSMVGKEGEYYLIIIPYTRENSVLVERIS